MDEISAKDQYCRNCHYPLQAKQKFCGHCGQKRTTGRVTLWALFGELFSTIFNLENKTLSTLRKLFQPGRLTSAYFNGQHKRYVHPVRLFFVIVVATIALISFQVNDDLVDSELEEELDTHNRYYGMLLLQQLDSTEQTIGLDTTNQQAMAIKDSLESYIINKLKATRNDTIELDQINLFGEESPKVKITDLYQLSSDELEEKYVKDAPLKDRIIFRQKTKFTKNVGNFIPYIIGRLSWLLIMLLPLLGLALKLFYIRRNFYIVEHVVFSMHVHSFIFILLFLALLLNEYFGEVIWFTLLFLLPVYVYLAMMYYYKQGWFKTLIKFSMLGFIYVVLFSVCMVLTLLLGFVLY